ncbi:MAG: hypothetical protein Ct9H300mP28_28740 [Pseudomonadota bacterium]|nr:MAG: hypothetical protein Ct9H300mP28_28740 [Pseudomonadota bacterium]
MWVTGKSSMPVIRQLFVSHQKKGEIRSNLFENKLYVTRKAIRSSLQDEEDFVITSMSSRTIVTKAC